MPTDLEELRDHARRLSTSNHLDACDRIHRIVKVDRWLTVHGIALPPETLSCGDESGHYSHDWTASNGLGYRCPGLCGGCMPDKDREQWTRIADELDAFLARDNDTQEALL